LVLGSRQPLIEAAEQVITDAECIRHDGGGWIHRACRRKEARVDDEQVVDLVRLAVDVEPRDSWVVPEADRAVLVSRAGECDAPADEQRVRKKSLRALVVVPTAPPVLPQEAIQRRDKALVHLLIVRLVP
jgi:hypothetical protein